MDDVQPETVATTPDAARLRYWGRLLKLLRTPWPPRSTIPTRTHEPPRSPEPTRQPAPARLGEDI